MPRYKSVDWFAGEMNKVLLANSDKTGWLGYPINDLFKRLRDESDELLIAIHSDKGRPKDVRRIIKESVDVANFAMMIADNYRQESDEPGRTEGGS